MMHYREEDGHTYWRDDQGDIVGAPTFLDGMPDLEAATHLIDMDIDVHEMQRVDNWVTRRERRIRA